MRIYFSKQYKKIIVMHMCKRIKTVYTVLIGICSDFKYLSVLTVFAFFFWYGIKRNVQMADREVICLPMKPLENDDASWLL